MEPLLRRFPGLAGLPHVDLGVRPTPVEERRIGGLRVLVKRDDRTSPRYGGNKARCLEFLLAPRPRRVLTFSSLHAYHAYATAVHARSLGVPTYAVIVRKGRRGAALAGLGTVAERVREVRGAAGAALAALAMWRPGTRIVPPGGASPRGALGYVVAALELEEVPQRIYVPMGTGTTVSGLLAGLMLREARCEVVAVRVSEPFGSPWQRAFRAIFLLRRRDPSVPRPNPGGVTLRVVRFGGRYGEETPAAAAAVRAAAETGLDLETTYTGPTLATLLAERPEGALLVNTYAGTGAAAAARDTVPG